MDDHIIDIVILACLVLSAVWAVLSPRLLRAVIALAVASICVTLALFRLDSPLAGVFELSVCSGLISAVFISTISLSALETDASVAQSSKERIRRYFSALETDASVAQSSKERIRRYWFLPPLLLLVGVAVAQIVLPTMPEVQVNGDGVREVLWTQRHLDLLGQITVLLAGAFGVVVLFKGTQKKETTKNER
jgi:NADH-quinone oxidoreductase subunit J